jgi:hypothetical protein
MGRAYNAKEDRARRRRRWWWWRWWRRRQCERGESKLMTVVCPRKAQMSPSDLPLTL